VRDVRCLGLPLSKWRDNLSYVVNAINRGKKNYKSQLNLLLAYFTEPEQVIVPQQQDQFYKFKIGQRVRMNLTKAERKALPFKYSLNCGKLD